MTLRRGLKTEANSTALEVRGELGLGLFDPRSLAEWLEIPICTLSEMCTSHPTIGHLVTQEPEAFSAVTVFRGRERTIVHNDGHAPVLCRGAQA